MLVVEAAILINNFLIDCNEPELEEQRNEAIAVDAILAPAISNQLGTAPGAAFRLGQLRLLLRRKRPDLLARLERIEGQPS